MQLAYSNDRLASRMAVDPSAAGEPEVESSVIEWLLHDDQVMRECFIHAAEILKSVTGAAITAITLLDEEYQHYRAEVGMAMPLVTRARSLADYAVRDAELFVIEDAHDDSRFRRMHAGEALSVRALLRGDCAARAERRDRRRVVRDGPVARQARRRAARRVLPPARDDRKRSENAHGHRDRSAHAVVQPPFPAGDALRAAGKRRRKAT